MSLKDDGILSHVTDAESANDSIVLISAKELCKILKVAPRTLWRLLSARKIPQPLKIGGNTRWASTMIAKWIAAGCPPQFAS